MNISNVPVNAGAAVQANVLGQALQTATVFAGQSVQQVQYIQPLPGGQQPELAKEHVMLKNIAIFAAVFGLSPAPAFAAEQHPSNQGPQKLTDNQPDQVTGGDPLPFVNVQAPIGVHIEPITVSVGTQNEFNFGSTTTPGG